MSNALILGSSRVFIVAISNRFVTNGRLETVMHYIKSVRCQLTRPVLVSF